MSYQSALEAAGAVVLEFKHFGSYQGEWRALVNFQGLRGFVSGSYGSCAYCDAFESELGDFYEECEEHRYDDKHEPCEACDKAKAGYAEAFVKFGAGYLEDIKTLEEAVKEASVNIDWDHEAQEMVDWLHDTFSRHLEV